MYSYLLEQVQGILPDNFHIVLRTLEVETVPIKYVNEFFKYNKNKYEHFLKKDVEKVKPEKCNFCNLCDWAETCEDIWIKEDNLNQVGGINKNYIKKLKAHGIKTLTQLSKIKETEKIKDIKPQVVKKLVTQAKLQKEYQTTGKPIFKVIEQNLEKLEEFSNQITAVDYNDKGLFFIKYYTDQFIKFTLHAQTCLQNLESKNIDFILSMNKPSKYHIDQKIFLDGNKIFNSGLPSEHIITEQIIPCTIFDILLAGQETYIVNIGNQLGTQFFLPVNEIPDQDKFSVLNMIFKDKN